MPILLVCLLLLAACGRVDDSKAQPTSRLEPSAPPPGERHPLHEGFTQRPPKDTPGLPPPAGPLVSDADRAELAARGLRVSQEERERTQDDLLALVDAFEKSGE